MRTLLKFQTALPTEGPSPDVGWGQGPAHPLDFKVLTYPTRSLSVEVTLGLLHVLWPGARLHRETLGSVS